MAFVLERSVGARLKSLSPRIPDPNAPRAPKSRLYKIPDPNAGGRPPEKPFIQNP